MSTLNTNSNTNSKVISLGKDFTKQSLQHAYGYQPLSNGRLAPVISFDPKKILASYLPYGSLAGNENILIHELLEFKQPLVLVFFSAQTFNEKVLTEIDGLKIDVEIMGGKLILITNSFVRQIKRFAEDTKVTCYYDEQNEIAESFGLYDHNNPLYHWLSGIDHEKTILPAFYVIGADRRIAFEYVDYAVKLFSKQGFTQTEQARNLLSTVHHVNRQFQKPTWHKKIVL